MNSNFNPKKSWQPGLIVRLYIPFIRDVPKYFIILEIKDNWVIFTSLTSKEEKKDSKITRPNKYVIIHEPPESKYFGISINYNTFLVTSKREFLLISRKTYQGKKVISPNYLLNRIDFVNFKNEQKNYFQDPQRQKRLTRIIYTLSFSDQEDKLVKQWLPSYLLI